MVRKFERNIRNKCYENTKRTCYIWNINTNTIIYLFGCPYIYKNRRKHNGTSNNINYSSKHTRTVVQSGAGSIKKNGIVNGGIIGVIYILLIYLLSSITGSSFTLNIYGIIMMIAGIAAGALGGVVRS